MEINLNKFKDFSVGDVVKLKDGDGRHHVIKKFEIDFSIRTGFPFAIVVFEDNSAKGFISDDGISDMIKIDYYVERRM